MSAPLSSQATGSRPTGDSTLLIQGRILALLPIGKVALEAPDLIAQGQHLVLGQHLAAAAVATIAIAVTYRVVEWIMTVERKQQ